MDMELWNSRTSFHSGHFSSAPSHPTQLLEMVTVWYMVNLSYDLPVINQIHFSALIDGVLHNDAFKHTRNEGMQEYVYEYEFVIHFLTPSVFKQKLV